MNEYKSIMCPNCKTFLTKAKRNDDKVHRLACKSCRKWIWFTPSTDEFQIKKQPERTTASGKRYY